VAHDDRELQPLVSVVMACYNHEDFVGAAVESIQAQTYSNWELICVDDCSSDRTFEVLRRYAAGDSRIRCYRNAENLGGGRTRNVAISHASGDFIAIQDSDDVALPDRLELSLQTFAENPELGAVGGEALWMNAEGHDLPLSEPAKFADPTAMVRTEWVQAIGGYDEALRHAYEVDFYFRLHVLGCRFQHLGRPLLKARQHSGRTTRNRPAIEHIIEERAAWQRAEAMRRGETEDLQALIKQLRGDVDLEAKAHYRNGWVHLSEGNVAEARRAFAAAIALRPGHLTARLWRLLSHLPSSTFVRLMRLWERSKRYVPRKRGHMEVIWGIR